MLMEHEYVDPGCFHREMAVSILNNNYDLDKAFEDGIEDPEVLKALGLDENSMMPWWDDRSIEFMNDVPLEDVPLYINDRILGVFCKWRLSINR